MVKEILESRKHEPDGPFNFTKDQVYTRVKWLMRQACIEDASPHTLRKAAGSMFNLATRDIFATSRLLGHSSVRVTEQHYAGLIQSLQIENYQKFEEVMKGDSLYIRYLDIKPHQSPPINPQLKSPDFTMGKGASGAAGPTGIEPATSGLTGRRSNQSELRSR